MALASLDGKLAEYLKLVDEGMNTIQLDVKDENGEIGFIPSAVPLARAVGAARPYYRPREVGEAGPPQGRLPDRPRRHLRGSAALARASPSSRSRTRTAPSGTTMRISAGRTRTTSGSGTTTSRSPRSRRGPASTRSSSTTSASRPTATSSRSSIPKKTATPPGWVIAQFVHYATQRLKPLGVRVSADVFGLSATRDLGIGQIPRRLSKYVDAVYPMVYPSHFGSGEYGLEDPNASPGATVEWSLADFRRELKKGKAELIPWLQDFSYGRTYGLADVQGADRGRPADGRARLPALEPARHLHAGRARTGLVTRVTLCTHGDRRRDEDACRDGRAGRLRPPGGAADARGRRRLGRRLRRRQARRHLHRARRPRPRG